MGRRSSSCALFTCLITVLLSQAARADCRETWDACDATAEAKLDRCEDRCDRLYDSDSDRWESCNSRCESTQEREYAACEKVWQRCEDTADVSNDEAAGDTPRPNTSLYGARDSAKEGCYFGECPDGPTTRPPTERTPERTRPRTRPEETETDPPPRQTPVQTTAICQTPTFWCQMFVRGPVGMPCYCNTPFGYANGITVPQR